MVTALTTDMKSIKDIKVEMIRFMMAYKFALDEMNTKIDILKQEFQYIHDYNPIEHVKSRLKTPESIFKKVQKKGLNLNLTEIRENIRDIAGIRITCSFISDIYEIKKMLEKQKDLKVIECKDYIENPKGNGYRSLHMIIEIPIFMSDREEQIQVEVQIRTIAMDFWASLEHKIYYKYNKTVPERLQNELKEAAISAAQLDVRMEKIHKEMNALKEKDEDTLESELLFNNLKLNFPFEFISTKKENR